MQVVCDSLREALQQAATSFEGVQDAETLFSPTSWIMERYELIIHNKAKIEEYCSVLEEGDTKKHLEWFLACLESRQPGVGQKHDEVLSGSCQQILFKDLWVLYPPRTRVFKIDDSGWRAYVVERSETVVDGNITKLQIYAWFLDFDTMGERLIPHGAIFEVSSYSSERPIRTLELIPEWFIKQMYPLCQMLLERGKQHWGYHGKPFYKEYRGDAWSQAPRDVSQTLR